MKYVTVVTIRFNIDMKQWLIQTLNTVAESWGGNVCVQPHVPVSVVFRRQNVPFSVNAWAYTSSSHCGYAPIHIEKKTLMVPNNK